MKRVHIVVQSRAICGRPGAPTEWGGDEMQCGFAVKEATLLPDEQLCAKCRARRTAMRTRERTEK